jgi:hypothetical protein
MQVRAVALTSCILWNVDQIDAVSQRSDGCLGMEQAVDSSRRRVLEKVKADVRTVE